MSGGRSTPRCSASPRWGGSPTRLARRGRRCAIGPEPRPRIWRYYSIANAPREDETLDFHIRVIGGGSLSPALARRLAVGSRLRLGSPGGAVTLATGLG